MADRAPDDPPQHIATALVARDHAVDDQEGAGADMVGDHLERGRAKIGRPGELRRGGDQVTEKVDVVVAVHALQHRGEAFESHAGIDAGLGQRRQHAVVVAVELHENQVPDLDVAVALVRRARRPTRDRRAVIVEDFAARAAGAGVGHLPEVVRRVGRAPVVADAHHALRRHADGVGPCGVGLVVGLIHRDPELVGGQLVDLGQQLPRVGDRLALEIVAERPVAEHFEERVVACGVADVLQVVVLAPRAQATLHVGGADITALVGAQKDILELHHAAVGKKQCRIVAGHERRRRNDGMAPGGKIVEKLAAYGCDLHRNPTRRGMPEGCDLTLSEG